MSLPLGLYGLPMAGNNAGEETVMTQASNDAYAEFRRQMLSQVNATKSKRKSINENGSRPNSVTGDSDDNTVHGKQFKKFRFNLVRLIHRIILMNCRKWKR